MKVKPLFFIFFKSLTALTDPSWVIARHTIQGLIVLEQKAPIKPKRRKNLQCLLHCSPPCVQEDVLALFPRCLPGQTTKPSLCSFFIHHGIINDVQASASFNVKTSFKTSQSTILQTKRIWRYAQGNVFRLSKPKNTIGHFRVPLCLSFKASLSAKPFLWKWLWFAWKWNCM